MLYPWNDKTETMQHPPSPDSPASLSPAAAVTSILASVSCRVTGRKQQGKSIPRSRPAGSRGRRTAHSSWPAPTTPTTRAACGPRSTSASSSSGERCRRCTGCWWRASTSGVRGTTRGGWATRWRSSASSPAAWRPGQRGGRRGGSRGRCRRGRGSRGGCCCCCCCCWRCGGCWRRGRSGRRGGGPWWRAVEG